MKTVLLQRRGRILTPFSVEDLEAIAGFVECEPLTARISGVKKPRSYQQLKLYWACCQVVADNLEGKTKEDIDFETKVALHHVRAFRVVNGVVHVEVDSISYDRMKHLEACNYFDRAFPVLARMIGITEKELLQNAEKE